MEDLSFAIWITRNKLMSCIQLKNFSKAYDSVPHQWLLKELQHYGINNNIYNWKTWLTYTRRSQNVVLTGISSDSVQSGVPQGTVLNPLMFLLYINDISNNIHSPLHLFADDCLLYIAINIEQRCSSTAARPQHLKFNISKCSIWESLDPQHHALTFNYQLDDTILSRVNS